MKHLVSIHDMSAAEVASIVDLAVDIKANPNTYSDLSLIHI